MLMADIHKDDISQCRDMMLMTWATKTETNTATLFPMTQFGKDSVSQCCIHNIYGWPQSSKNAAYRNHQLTLAKLMNAARSMCLTRCLGEVCHCFTGNIRTRDCMKLKSGILCSTRTASGLKTSLVASFTVGVVLLRMSSSGCMAGGADSRSSALNTVEIKDNERNQLENKWQHP